ncbi:MAG: DUF5110 domain-containing protein [Prevotella sp.]|nr:DUF5110 domain-containing protein [Prevotella sp.]
MKKIIYLLLGLLICTTAKAQLTWEEIAPGIWKTQCGTPEEYSLLSVSACQPNQEGLSKMPSVSIPPLAQKISPTFTDGKVYLQLPLQREERLYGFGLNFKGVQQRGKIFELHVDHYGGKDNGRTHAPVPFYVSSEGYGILINSARYLTVYAGSGARKDSPDAPVVKDRNTDKTWSSRPYSDAVSVFVPAQGVEIYLFAGPTMMDVIRRYNLMCGGGPLPPRWGLGFTQRTQRLFTAADVLAEVDAFEEKGFPLDFVGLEPGWQSKAYPCTFEWDKGRYPDPASFVRALKEKHVRVNLWTNPYVSPDSKIYPSIYSLSASHTVWCGLVPDLASSQARKILGDKFNDDHLSIGVGGYKIDEVDGYDHYLWPDVALFPSGKSAEQMRQTYGLWVQRLTSDLFRQRNQRTFGLVRGSNAGGNSFPYVIYNDYYSHQDFITALINSGFCGVLWTPEVRSSKTAEEWVRRFQTVVFSPMAMINAWSSGTKPWTFPEVASVIKDYALLRMQMMPYWYTTFAQYHFDGIPPFRALCLDDLSDNTGGVTEKLNNSDLDENPYLEKMVYEIKDEYLAGDALLVAPLFVGETERDVVLPRGKWYDFYTGEYVGNGEVIKVKPGLERIPVFVRDGAIIPMMEPRLHAPQPDETVDIEFRHYGTSDGFLRLYDDDGETYDYEKGVYSWREVKVKHNKKGKPIGTISKPEKGKPNTIGRVTWKFMSEL